MSGLDTQWKRWYRALKAVEPDAYKKAIEYAAGVSLTYNMPLEQSAEVERSHVMLACELLGVTPSSDAEYVPLHEGDAR